jgi:hypothetical protein
MALPLARVRVQREKERRLRDALTEMRKAIDRYKDYADAGKLGQVDPESNGYPESLEVLVEGVEVSDSGAAAGGFGNIPGGNFGQPAGQGNRSGRGGMGSNRGSSSNRGGFGSNRGGSGSSGFGQSNRGSSSSRGGFGSSRGGMGSSSGGMGSSGMGSSGGFGTGEGSGSDDEDKKIRFLRRIPVDPMTGMADWGMRSISDSPDSMSWGGRNVFDVFSKSMDMSLDGTRYSEW